MASWSLVCVGSLGLAASVSHSNATAASSPHATSPTSGQRHRSTNDHMTAEHCRAESKVSWPAPWGMPARPCSQHACSMSCAAASSHGCHPPQQRWRS